MGGIRILNGPRTFCALGAQQPLLAINGVIPILQAGRTCTYRLYQGMSQWNGHQGIGTMGGSSIICTGMHNIPVPNPASTDTLSYAVEAALRITNADLYVVLTGCLSEIIGDDTAHILRPYQERGIPILSVHTAGFQGNAYSGHEKVVKALVEYLCSPKAPVDPLRVNLWVDVPYLNPFWSGNLDTLKHLLEEIGLKPNILFGMHSSVENWKNIPSAACNLLLSPWCGLEVVREMKRNLGIPFLHYPVLPMGAVETSRFLRWLAEQFPLNRESVESVIRRHEQTYYSYIERLSDLWSEYHRSFPDRFFLVADSADALGLSRFLIQETGFAPGAIYCTDAPPHRYRSAILESFEATPFSLSNAVYFLDTEGQETVNIKKEMTGCIPLLFGSTWDQELAGEFQGAFVGISTPLPDRLILNRSYVGYTGGLRLLEDIYSAILAQCD